MRFRFFQKHRTGFALSVPERWSDLEDTERRHLWKLLCNTSAAVDTLILRKVLKPLPLWSRLLLRPEDSAAMLGALKWATLRPECNDIALPEITLHGTRYVLAKPLGRNVVAGEFAVCNDLYTAVVAKNDTHALQTLTAVLYREADRDEAAAQARGDERVPYRNKDEAEARLARMGEPPAEMQIQALYYFAGLKQQIHRMYGRFIFDNENQGDAPTATIPDYGWWGVLQGIAESGVFGDLRSTYQSYIHEICVYLVRKKAEADALKAAQENARNASKHHTDDL